MIPMGRTRHRPRQSCSSE
ncbi:MAG: hypothetical protein D6725_10940 [Planctomycetota bacterium]|nr:MAG: hypothetical protein D6725_10940 [Planctomycetota bacterium]